MGGWLTIPEIYTGSYQNCLFVRDNITYGGHFWADLDGIYSLSPYRIVKSGNGFTLFGSFGCGNAFPEIVTDEMIEEFRRDRGKETIKHNKKNMREFDKTLKGLTKARDEGKIDQMITGLGAIMAFTKSQRETRSHTPKVARADKAFFDYLMKA
uniref:Uncharacterized protein n=1 Tax=viral metagenome TaxID=1070528 RepID=A0A6H2A2D8_9ZZZZ